MYLVGDSAEGGKTQTSSYTHNRVTRGNLKFLWDWDVKIINTQLCTDLRWDPMMGRVYSSEHKNQPPDSISSCYFLD
jgi:hypothetical protein